MPEKQPQYQVVPNVSNDDDDDDVNIRHQRLQQHPRFWALVGVTHTLLTAGIVFGWASLLPVLREEGVDHSPQAFSSVFTVGAVGNYLSTLFFGAILDRYGPRTTGIAASLLFALGLLLSSAIDNFACLAVGIALLGFAGPGIQLPTLHLANLFKKDQEEEESRGGGAVYMSAQAAAFDGGTAVFAILRVLSQSALALSSSAFLRFYLVVPAWVLLTAIFVWPDEIIEDDRNGNNGNQQETYVGPGSPYLSPQRKKRNNHQPSLVNAPLRVVLKHPAFWSLAAWVSVHILKLNFVVATINDQLHQRIGDETAQQHLIDVFGAMLPFGFVVLPIVAFLLERSALLALQLANVVGLIYGGILVFFPWSAWLQTLLVFPSVATSRQLVYSTVFHQIGELFGFANYGVLLGLTNLCVSTISMVQTPLVSWSERAGSYAGSNTLLWLTTVPLLGLVLWSDPKSSSSSSASSGGETSPLKKKNQEKQSEGSPTRRYSAV